MTFPATALRINAPQAVLGVKPVRASRGVVSRGVIESPCVRGRAATGHQEIGLQLARGSWQATGNGSQWHNSQAARSL